MKVSTTLRLEIDAALVAVDVPVGTTLAELLREHGRSTVRIACGEGMCGACAVVLDGSPVASCSVFAHDADGRVVETAEGPNQLVRAVRELVDELRAFQCGFCTPGFVMAIVAALLAGRREPEEIVDAIDGNYCRCGAYTQLQEVVTALPGRLRAEGWVPT